MKPAHALLLALCMTATAQAEVYKCSATGGGTSFQSTPCKPGQGEKIDAKPAQTFAAINEKDAEWLRVQKPLFKASCMTGIGQANDRAGQLLSADDVGEVCSCSTQRYFSSIPIARLREWREGGDRDSEQERLTEVNQKCVNDVIAGQTFSSFDRAEATRSSPAAKSKVTTRPGTMNAGEVDEESILHDLR